LAQKALRKLVSAEDVKAAGRAAAARTSIPGERSPAKGAGI